MSGYVSDPMRDPVRINIIAERIVFETWCEMNDLDPEDDENYNSYCEWKGNQ